MGNKIRDIMKSLALLLILMLMVGGGVIVLSSGISVSQEPPPPPPPPPPTPPPPPPPPPPPQSQSNASKGYILKRSVEDTCHGCHRTEKNTPSSGQEGYVEEVWNYAIKMHNSRNMGSTKWSGNWGTADPGSMYGEFLCTTCHTAHDTKNIYLIKENITTPDGSNWGSSGNRTVGVDFRKKSGIAGVDPGLMGDDTNEHSTSVMVCTVCHSSNKYHNYDTAKATSMSHNNASECSSCHDHKGGFKPSCRGCHGYPPQNSTIGSPGLAKYTNGSGTGSTVAGAHVYHSTGSGMNYKCAYCHFGSVGEGPTHNHAEASVFKKITMGFVNIFNNINITGGIYNAQMTANYDVTDANTTVNKTGAKTCSVYCHGSTMPTNGGTATSPVWDAATNSYTCSNSPGGPCHGANALNPPSLGSHIKHSSSAEYGFACALCHNSTGNSPTGSHVSGTVQWAFSPDNRTSGATYNNSSSGSKGPAPSVTYNSCTNLYCHSNASPIPNNDGAKNEPNQYKTPTWGGGPMACYSCHKGRTSNGDLTTQQTNDNTEPNCNNAGGYWDTYCTTTQTLCGANNGTWDPVQRVCRNVAETQCTTTLSGRYVQVCVNSRSDPTLVLAMKSNAHRRLVSPQWIRKYPCVYCHADTVDAYGAVRDKTKHVNSARDIKIHTTQAAAEGIKNWGIDQMPSPSYNSSTRNCSNIYCHSDGRENIDYLVVSPAPWNGPSMTCNSCHGHPLGSCDTDLCHDGVTVQSNNLVLATLCSGIAQAVCEANGGTWGGSFCRGLKGEGSDTTGRVKCGSLGGKVDWPAGKEWMAAAPMFPNGGPGSGSENSHPRHIQNDFACSVCHYNTVRNGACSQCHSGSTPLGSMGETAHVNATYHVNKMPDIAFQDTVNYKFYNGRSNPNGTPGKNPKSCENPCHVSPDTGTMNPAWGGSLNDSYAFCKGCHGTTNPDVDFYGNFSGDPTQKPLINLNEWRSSGHGRPGGGSNNDPYANPYTKSLNPAANFESAPNPCWYCHDNNVLHTDPSNPFRLKKHDSFRSRFEKECVYCHMERTPEAGECCDCHYNQTESLSPQVTAGGVVFKQSDGTNITKYGTADPANNIIAHTFVGTWNVTKYTGTCISQIGCHDSDNGYFTAISGRDSNNNPIYIQKGHNESIGVYNPDGTCPTGYNCWNTEQKNDIRNQYVWMGVCLKCHDEDSEGQCTSCHQAPANNPNKYSLGYDGGMGPQYFNTAVKAKASSFHFGYKHYDYFTKSGGWAKDVNGNYVGATKGGKFCWDCHDPHGDENIYMVHSKPEGASQGGVSTATDGTYGKPLLTADVSFTSKSLKGDYAKSSAPYNGICNVCHQTLYDNSNNILVEAKHYTNTSGDGHNDGKVCTSCHNHKFTDSHSSGLECTTCHLNKPVPRHTGFSLPRDCTKCHIGIGKRIDVMGQMQGNSHHVQGMTITNRHCYACHWEATSLGLMDTNYHAGYNYKTHKSVPGASSDLVIWGPGTRPATYILSAVLGTDGNTYTSIQDHTAASDNKPTTGANWAQYWVKAGMDGAAWVSGTQYSAATATTFSAVFVGSSNNFVCSIPGIGDQAACTSSHICSSSFGGVATTYATQDECEAAGYGWVAGIWAKERDEVEKTTPHCLGCHSDKNKDTKAFGYCSSPLYLRQSDYCSKAGYNDRNSCQAAGGQWLAGCENANNPSSCSRPGYHSQVSCESAYYCSMAGYNDQTHCENVGGKWIHATWSKPKWLSDCKTPRQYAWDRMSIADRYSQTGTTSWGKYFNTAQALILPLDEALWYGVAGEVKDSSPNGNNGTAYNAVTVQNGKFKRAGNFNGTSSYISVPAASSLNITGPISISVWLNFNSLPQSTQRTVLLGSQQYTLWVTYPDQVNPGVQIVFRDAGGRGVTTSSANLTTGVWYHVAGVFSGVYGGAIAGNTKIYINGVEQATTVSGSAWLPPGTSNPTVYVGSNGSGAFFDGLIDEVVIYKSALTNDEVQLLAQGAAEYIGCDPALCATGQKNFTKAYSAHGNVTDNEGGWDNTGGTGLDGDLKNPTNKNMRTGTRNVQCFDCHSSHGSTLVGNTSSYTTTYGPKRCAAKPDMICSADGDCYAGATYVGPCTNAGPWGGNLKETKANRGGYAVSYKASSNASLNSVNPYGAGAGQCFDCHETANVSRPFCAPTSGVCTTHSDQQSCEADVADNCSWSATGKPWGYSETYGVSYPIFGYKDTPKFGQGVKASQARYTYRAAKNTILGGHLHASTPGGKDLTKDSGTATSGSATTLTDTSKAAWTDNQWANYYLLMQSGANSGQIRKITASSASPPSLTVEAFANPVNSGDPYKIVPYASAINGLCTPCHDPHGVSPTLGANQAYGVPLLKGAWLTSPFKEDTAQDDMGVTTCVNGVTYQECLSNGGAWHSLGFCINISQSSCNAIGGVWNRVASGGFITFDRNPTPYVYTEQKSFTGGARIAESDTQFGGLCMGCHPKVNLTDGNISGEWKGLKRVHTSVKGWSTNPQHSYPCSKCHQPHNSGLPRLMVTDCLDYKHRGRVASGGTVQTDRTWYVSPFYATGTASSGTTTTLTVSTNPSWTPGQWATGIYYLDIYLYNASYCRLITGNSGNSLTFDAFPYTVPANASFKIVGHMCQTEPSGDPYSSGGFPWGYVGNKYDYSYYKKNCHPTGSWPDNRWNNITDW